MQDLSIKTKPVLYLLGITTKKSQTKMTKEIKVLSLNNLDRSQIDIFEDITRTEVHYWRRNEDGGLDLCYDDMGESQGKEDVYRG
jgi:hypothetical protein